MSDTASTGIRTLLQHMVNALTWEETRQLVADNQALLLTDEADAEFVKWIDEGSALNDVLTKADLICYRAALQRCRTDGIDATFDALPEPRPLNKALRAFLNADGPQSLSQVVQLFPEITSDDADEALQDMIARMQETEQERAAQLAEFFAMIQMMRLANRPIPADLLQLLTDWIDTDTWNESRAFLQANAERLLSEEAIESLTTMLLQSLGEDQEETEILLKHRAILEKARAESISAAYAPLLKPPDEQDQELLDAIQAMIAVNSRTKLIELVAQRPILLTGRASTEIERLITALREDGQENVASGLEERYETLKQIKASSRQIDKELVDLVIDWINTDTWDASQEMLKTHAERLLSDEAIEVIDVLLAEETGKDEEQPNQRAITALQQHRAILEKARKDSIDAAYAPFEAQRDPINALLQVLLQAQTPAQLQQAIAQYPALLDDETLHRLNEMASATEQAGNTAAASILRLRLGEIQRIRQLREQAARTKQNEAGGFDDRVHTSISAEDHSMAFDSNSGSVYQFNQSIEKSPEKQWQQPAQQTLDRKFVGRQDELDMLLRYLTSGENVTITGQPATTTNEQTTSAILQGMAGIGKTFLARKLAIEIDQHYAEIFPGRVIWVEVGPDVKDKSDMQRPLWELANFAFAGSAPAGPMNPQTVKSWLEETAPGRLLVILDDVWYPAALSILSEALPAKVVRLVTTRHVGVAKTLEGKLIRLGLLSLEDGMALLEARLHCQHNTPYQGDLTALVEFLEGHALALDIAAAQIEEPEEVKTLLDDLRQEIGRGELSGLRLQGEERDYNLEKSLARSYKYIGKEQQSHFRSLGIFATETLIIPEAAAAIWGTDADTARKILNELQRLALLNRIGEPGNNTYRQHSLLRAYALALLTENNELTSASWSHAHYYADLVWQAEQATPKNYPLLDQHLQNILAALQWSEENEPRLFSRLLDGASQFLFLRGQFSLLQSTLPPAADAAATIGEKGRQANLLLRLGDLERHLGHLEAARSHYDAALPRFKAVQDQLGQANLLLRLGDLERRLGHLEEARTHYDAALPLFKAEQDQLGQANLLKSLGDLERHLGHLEAARSHYDAALPLYKAEQDQLGQANLLLRLGDLERRLGHLEAARSHYDAALPLFQAVQSQLGQANLLQSLGDLERHLGHLEEARSHYDAALPLFKAVQDQLGQANLLKSLGDLERHLGHLEAARTHYDAALPLYKAEQSQLGQANVYMSIADMFLAQNEWEQARSYYEQALPLFIAVQDPLGQANTLIDLGRVRFELGEREQGIKDVERAASLFRSLQNDEWARRAELYLAQMRSRLSQSLEEDSESVSVEDAEILQAFINANSPQKILQLVQQQPQLLTDTWFALIEALIAAQQDEGAEQYLNERFDTLKQIKQEIEQERVRAIVADIARALDEFARADWGKRRELLQSRGELLLSEAVEPVCDILVEANKENGSVVALLESLRVLLRRCRTWGVDAAFYFALQMRLGDEVDIPAAYEDAIMQAAGLLARRGEDGEALAQAVEAMEKLVQSLPTDQKGLFRGALLRDLADATLSLPRKHPLRRMEAIEAYYREALAIYQDQAPDRPISQAVMRRALGEALSEQGRYGEAAETLQAAIQGFKGNEGRTSDTAWALSAYASALDNLGREEEALAAYNEAIELLPDTAPLLRNRTETLISLRRLEEAEADLARAVELDGNEHSPYLWFRRAQLAIARGDGTQAEQMIEEALNRDASFDVSFAQAQSAWLRGDLATAQQRLRQALEQANQGTRAATRREMERLLEEHPELAGGDEMRAMLNGSEE